MTATKMEPSTAGELGQEASPPNAEGGQFIRLAGEDLSVGKALPWPIYDEDMTFLMREGHVFETQEQIDNAVRNGLYRRRSGILTKKDKEVELERVRAEKARLADESLRGRFEDMSAKIGDPLLLQVMASYGDERCKVRLIGYVAGETVIVEAPSGAGNFVAMREGQELIARSFSGKLAYGFSTTVAKVCNSPLPYLHLAYPEYVQKAAVRESTRVAFSVIGTATKLQGDAESDNFSVLLVDFSTTGAAFTAQSGVAEKGSILRLSFRIKIQAIEVLPVVECIVRSHGPIEGDTGARQRFGVQFKDLKTQDLLVLQSMVYQKMLENV